MSPGDSGWGGVTRRGLTRAGVLGQDQSWGGHLRCPDAVGQEFKVTSQGPWKGRFANSWRLCMLGLGWLGHHVPLGKYPKNPFVKNQFTKSLICLKANLRTCEFTDWPIG